MARRRAPPCRARTWGSRGATALAAPSGGSDLPIDLRLELVRLRARELRDAVPSEVLACGDAATSLFREVAHESREVSVEVAVGQRAKGALGLRVDGHRERLGRAGPA